MINEQEQAAAATLLALGIKSVPVDVFSVARDERIELCPTKTATDFCGRIEYHSDLGRFLLFYPDLPDVEENVRVRFSVAHELGHYYLEEHREMLMAGAAHSSLPGFVCDKVMEIEADCFASGLLIPEWLLQEKLRTSRKFLTLSGILQLAKDCKSSRESAAIRYVKYAEEICVVVLSRAGEVLYSVASDDAERVRLFVKRGTQIPASAAARRAKFGMGSVDCEIPANTWCSWTNIKSLFEESVAIDRSGLVLTLLVYTKI